MAGGHHVEPLDGVGLVAGAEFVEVVGGVGELGEELGGDFGADFVAAGADAGADGGEEVARVGAEVHLHFADGFGGMRARVPRQPAWMAAMARFLGSTRRMGTQSAVWMARRRPGRLVMVASPRQGSDGAVSKSGLRRSGIVLGRRAGDRGAGGGLEAAAIFEDVFAGVPVGEAEIQDLFVFEWGDAAGAGAEGVD